MKLTIATIIIAVAVGVVCGQAPTLRIQTDDPNLPSDLYYGNVKVKPLRVRPGTNPPQFITIDDSDFFVQQQYIDFLNRFPDASGFSFWLNQITSCGSNQPCIDVARINDSGAFFLSIEFQQTGYLVERMYKSAYGDASGNSTFGGNHTVTAPIVTFAQFIPDVKQIGNGVIVNVGNWQQQLEANKVSFSQTFVQRSQFTSAYATSMSPANFVKKLGDNAGVPANDPDRTKAVNEFNGAADTSDVAARGRALRDIAENASVFNAEQNRAFVLMQYFGYLRRDPNGTPDTDYTGYDFWLTKLNQFNGNFISAEMVKAFITASEYKTRF
ncbi:MAG TPA: hypothetical protein VE863_01245 [Pyrinomonadaceae bacterium]|jgi:hypothetical protein|nr:hypothetical protein [Pyrinomonadaceae bacterium]